MYQISKAMCSACGLCADVCPVEAISQYGEYKIDPARCNLCGLCKQCCPSGAIKAIKNGGPTDDGG